MAAFLTTPKMHPALAARIEASVRKGRTSGDAHDRRVMAVFRWIALAGIVASASSLAIGRHRQNAEVSATRAALIDGIRKNAASVTADDRALPGRVNEWLSRSAGTYEGDFRDASLRNPEAFDEKLGQPLVYVRGPLAAFTRDSERTNEAAASGKDSFVLCLLDPPKSSNESALLARVHAAYSGGERLREHTGNVHRLWDIIAFLPLLSPEWEARVKATDDPNELAKLSHDFSKAPLEEARRGAASRLLLYVMDEPGPPGGVTELDGERPHDVRVGLVDMAAQHVLLRLRKRVDPSFASVDKRAQYASGLDSCALALDVRAASVQDSPR